MQRLVGIVAESSVANIIIVISEQSLCCFYEAICVTVMCTVMTYIIM